MHFCIAVGLLVKMPTFFASSVGRRAFFIQKNTVLNAFLRLPSIVEVSLMLLKYNELMASSVVVGGGVRHGRASWA